MGVMKCDRYDCDYVCCTRCILNNTRYICDNCHEELEEYRSTWPDVMSPADITTRISNFFDSPIGTHRVLRGDDLEAEIKRQMG